MKHKPVIAFIGAGNMSSSLIGGLIKDQYPPNLIWATNPSSDKLSHLKSCFHINVTEDNKLGATNADVLVCSVKPSILKQVVLELKDIIVDQKPLILSVAAGIKSGTIKKWLGDNNLPIVRCMPNTPALLQCGTTALYATKDVSEEQRTMAESIMRSVGITLWLKDEAEIDIVTAISGSGPAYFFLVMEAILDCAKKMGLSQEQAELLTINTALGAARMALESDKDVHSLRCQVTSPGGTTEQAIKALESGGLRELFVKALNAAHEKALKMSELVE